MKTTSKTILQSINEAVKIHSLLTCQTGQLDILMDDYNDLHLLYEQEYEEDKKIIYKEVSILKPIIGKRLIEEFNKIPDMPI